MKRFSPKATSIQHKISRKLRLYNVITLMIMKLIIINFATKWINFDLIFGEITVRRRKLEMQIAANC